MANYRTVVPGVQNGNEGTVVNQPTPGHAYPDTTPAHSGTRIQGVEDPRRPAPAPEPSAGKPLVGFLVSVSRTEEAEYWVLRQGQNLIGSGPECDIVLNELSVSKVHAVLAIHRNPGDNNRLNVGIMERGSSNGIFVNDTYIGFNPCQCKNLDKIRLGNYEFLLFLFDAREYGLKKAENFASKPSGNFDYTDRELYPNDKTRY
ncbi:MAG: FHA domain-containing protein [Tannerellaceae bacterium]|jgi:pSer/pThr/pTyr-binding forkhead associated (FHA) protein|nr:FHA domain-containing protein [Tannerellaceae bacterium]